MKHRSVVLGTSLLAVGLLIASATSAHGTVPTSTATKVAVTASGNASGIDAHLHGAASIAGTITAAAGGSISATVAAYIGNRFIRNGFTDGTGHYLIGGLAANATGYAVCVSPFGIFGGNSTTGYLGRCYTTAAFNGSTVPSSAQKIPLTPGQQKTGVNITIPSGAAISGKIVNGSGTGIAGVSVTARNKNTGATGFGFTSSTGVYKITGLTGSSTGYAVCADPNFTNAGTTGYRPRCYKDVAWNGGSIPSGANSVSVSLGHTHTGINITLPRGGAISGVVKNGSGVALADAGVVVFSSTGGFRGSATTNSTGHYTVKGLAASTSNRVCVFPFSPSASVTYHGKCWKNVAWNGGALPSGTTGVSTTIGSTHSGINFTLSKSTISLGSIAGTVTELAGGTALQQAEVSLFSSSGSLLDTKDTDSSGHYKFSSLRANSTGYVICAQANFGTFSATTTTPDTGWAPRCHTDVLWNGLTVPSTANRVPLSAGQNKTGINVALHVGGEISGTVNNDAGSPTFISGVTVELFTATGKFVTSTSSSFTDGTYSFIGLSPSATGYIVCFDGRSAVFNAPNYLPQCYNGVSWDGEI